MSASIGFAALAAAAPASARMGSSWGGSIMMVDLSSGAIIRELPEPCMMNGFTGGDAQIQFEWDAEEKFLRASWNDVVLSSGGTQKWTDPITGESMQYSKREMVFSGADLSTSTRMPDAKWVAAEATPLPAAGVEAALFRDPKAPTPPKLPFEWDEWQSVLFWNKTTVLVWPGYSLDAYDLSSGKKSWSVDFNPMNDGLPGSTPRARVFETGNLFLVATDRVGMRALKKETGELAWFLPYGNADVIPAVVLTGNRVILAPVGHGEEEFSCLPNPVKITPRH